MEAVLSGRADGTSNGTGSANIAIGEIAAPGTFKIFCSNPSNVKNVLDEVIVQIGSVTLGRGKPLFPRHVTNPPLQLVSARKIGAGFAELRYEMPKDTQAGTT